MNHSRSLIVCAALASAWPAAAGGSLTITTTASGSLTHSLGSAVAKVVTETTDTRLIVHPPFGDALFYLRGIAPKTIKTRDIYLGAIPWLGLQLLLVALLIAFPAWSPTSLLRRSSSTSTRSRSRCRGSAAAS